ncbi:hypothetical protein AMS68_006643 [Peltaster fructicola]|uniref:Thiamine pyrophosphokinase n=1 Tax=Peltaster fructicola TaxID=286661 RepID=A0A6H0Y2G3_9PEZI|nr:hypothetical protein AMS68_006643 [Peltaster fructicola]
MQKGATEISPRLDPARFLSRSTPLKHEDHGTALIILNSHIANFECFQRLYNHADFVVCADAGADRLFDLVTEQYSDLAYDIALQKHLPQYIHGDLDSISPKVQQAYANLGVKVTKDPDQYSTDFQKAVKRVFEIDTQARDILVLGSLGGRVDQGIGLVHELYREHKRRVDTRIWFFSESSISVVLERGHTTLATPLGQGIIRKHAGILPIYGPAVISTRGFEWDVHDWHTEMGSIVSTSNHIVQDVVEVSTDREVLFTVELSASLSDR